MLIPTRCCLCGEININIYIYTEDILSTNQAKILYKQEKKINEAERVKDEE